MKCSLTKQQERNFWNKVRIKEGEDGCWIWTASKTHNGYGRFRFNFNGQRVSAHRLSWMIHFGVIPNGLLVCHKCDVKLCVNPNHLFLGTNSDNVKDCVAKGRNTPCHGDKNGTRKHPEKLVRGSARRDSKLSEKDIPEIRIRYGYGASQRVIADEFHVTQTLISQIIRGKIWRHVL